MPRKPKKVEDTTSFSIILPKTKKRNLKERRAFFKKMKSLVEQDKESLPIKEMSFEKNVIALEAEDFKSKVSFNKPISISIEVTRDFEKNKNRVNELANKITNYLNTILGESAEGAKIFSISITSKLKGINLARKFVEEARLAKINELTKKTLNPMGIMFEYKTDAHENAMMYVYGEKQATVVTTSSFTFKELIPWNFVMEEYINLKDSIEIIKKLTQKEF